MQHFTQFSPNQNANIYHSLNTGSAQSSNGVDPTVITNGRAEQVSLMAEAGAFTALYAQAAFQPNASPNDTCTVSLIINGSVVASVTLDNANQSASIEATPYWSYFAGDLVAIHCTSGSGWAAATPYHNGVTVGVAS
jgi:hypothetical protein